MMIYFIQCGDGGPIKIGRTTSAPHARMSYFQLGCPYELSLIGAIHADAREELALHQRLIRDHIRGEWFRPSADVLRAIREALMHGRRVQSCGEKPARRASPRGTKHLRHLIEGRAA